MKILLFLASVLSFSVVSAPVNAQTENVCSWDYTAPSASESMCWPLQTEIVVIESPYRNIWGIRRQARELTNYVDLTFMWYRGVQCEDFPTATCVRVEKSNQNFEGYSGYATFSNLYSTRTIYLDSAWEGNPSWRDYRRYVGLHEFGHTLGLSHHTEVGVMGSGINGLPLRFSNTELSLLQQEYN